MGSLKKKVIRVELAKDQHGEPQTWTHQKSGTVFHNTLVTFEDKSIGTYTHEGKSQDHFNVGQEAEFNAENKGTWWKLTKPKKKWDKHPGGWVPKSPAEIKRDNVGFAAGYVKDMIIAGKAEKEDVKETLALFMEAISDEIDKIED